MAKKRKRQRAPRGGGSVFRVDDPARWRSPWRAQVNGRSRYFADEGSARAWAAQELARLSAPERAPIPLLSEALAEWLESRHYTRGGTQATYATRAVLALSALPDVPITQIGLKEVMAMDAVLRQDYAAETCEHVLTLLRAVCKRQALFGVLSGPNPVEVYREAVTSRARGGRPERQRVALDAYQVRVLLANMDGYLRPFVAWLAVLGFARLGIARAALGECARRQHPHR